MSTQKPIVHLIIVILTGLFLLSGCSLGAPTSTPPTATVSIKPTATEIPAATENPTTDGSSQFSLNAGNLATDVQTETIAAVSASENVPPWEVLPAYIRATLNGYPVTNHLMKPQIFIYPTQDLAMVNEGADMITSSLQSLLQSHQETPNMPFLPLFNAAQVMHVQVQYLDFKNGRGVRYLTQFSQGMMPINNYDLIYTYQGLTNDGKYYVAAVLPVNHPSLAADEKVTGNEPAEFTSDFPAYLANIVAGLNPQAASTFTPDLTQLDAMMSSLEIK